MPHPRARRNRRRVLTAVALVAAGVVVNVLVAWGCMLWSPVTWTAGTSTRSSTRSWLRPVIFSADWTMRTAYIVEGFGLSGVQVDDIDGGIRAHTARGSWSRAGACTTATMHCGWPLRCLTWGWAQQEQHQRTVEEGYTDQQSPTWSEETGVYVYLRLIDTPLRPRPLNGPGRKPVWSATWPRLPIEPMWRPLLVNTAIWTAAVAAVVLSVQYWLRSRRVRAGLCPKCRYPIGVSPVCTECGAALPVSAKNT